MQIKQSITHLKPAKHTVYKYLLILSILQYSSLWAISVVYNFHIAQVTKQPIFKNKYNWKHKIAALMFEQYHKKYLGTHRNFAGVFGSFVYDFGQNYFRVDGAFSHIKEVTNQTTTFSGTETDDILFSFGRGFALTDQAPINLSALFGVPTHKVDTLKHADFGYGLVGSGIQIDGSYRFNDISTFIYGGRYIHFFPRKATDILNQKHNFTLGNFGDILCAWDNSWTQHGVELGYTFRTQFGLKIDPSFDGIVPQTIYLSNFYTIYKYTFLVHNIGNRLLFNIAYSLNHTPQIYKVKHVFTIWAAWGIAF